MLRYVERVPDVNKITQALISRGVIAHQGDIENDHIAFRTMGVRHLGIRSLEKLFLHYGYTACDDYYFSKKKLNARWYAPPSPDLPRIFISELIVDAFPKPIQTLIRSYTDEVTADPVEKLNLDIADEADEFLHSALWRIPTLKDYKQLLEVSEYAAWVIYNLYYLNHYTLSVHNFPPPYNTLEKFNEFLVGEGIVLNASGGYIKESADKLLLQSATMAQNHEANFPNNETYTISGSYVEFAERRVLPEFAHMNMKEIKREYRREGFETGNADKIFESTYKNLA